MLGKGKRAALILALAKDKGHDREPEGSDDEHEREHDDSDGDDDLVPAAEDIISAQRRGDAKALAEALCDFLHTHEGCSR